MEPPGPDPAFFDEDEVQEEPPEPVRRYQYQNMKDLDVAEFMSGQPAAGSTRKPALLPYFVQTHRYRTTAVLEESVIDNNRIRQTAFLKNLDPKFVDELFKVEDCVRAVVFMPDQLICREGESADSMIVIVKGEAQVTWAGSDRQVVLGEGTIFGELAFLGEQQRRRATLTARSFCDVRIMYRSAWERTLASCTEVRDEVQQVARAFLVRQDVDSGAVASRGIAREDQAIQKLMRRASKKFTDTRLSACQEPLSSSATSLGDSRRNRLRQIGKAPGVAGRSIMSPGLGT